MPLSNGRIKFGSDFLTVSNDMVWGTGTLAATFGGGISFTSVNEGSFANTVDEPGGILAITTDTGDNDNAAIFAGPFKAADGGMTLEARFKYSNVDTSVYVGFCETLALDTPVMPAEFATATMTYNGTGGMVGLQYDVDGTTDDWRAVMGDGGAAVASSGNGTRANATVTADRWVEAKVTVFPDGSAECWLGDVGHADANGVPILRLIKKFSAGLTPTDQLYAVLMSENRSGNARVLEVDLFEGEAGRDWACT
jgi:hypothetical protein